MKKETEKPKDKWVRVIFIPIVGILTTLLFAKQQPESASTLIYVNAVVSIFSTFILWQGNRFIVILLRNRFADYKQIANRLFWQILLCTAFSLLASNSIFLTLKHLFPASPLCNEDRIYMSQYSLIITFLIIAIYEGTYYFGKWRTALIEAEELKRESIVSQFEALKSQVNPHFLFNSLNTLTALIEENPTTAVRFVSQLSQVYRYVLQSKEKGLTDLKTELEFTQSYIFLLQNRFEKNLVVQLNIEPQLYAKKIAPLCIQMLIENAIKHNIIASDRPLRIEIYAENNTYLVVKNNLQKKNFSELNHGLGLPNIIHRYAFLTTEEVRIEQTTESYKVSLPLIEDENSHH